MNYLQAHKTENTNIVNILGLLQDQGSADSKNAHTNFEATMNAYRHQVALACRGV